MSEIITTEEVTAAATAFLTAFDQLDWEPFSRFIAPDATVFMPFANVQRRLEGKAAIEAVFADFFARVRQERSGPSYLDIRPVDLDIHLLGDSALVTFHLDNGVTLSRRTAIFQKRAGEWYLLHLHASNMAIGDGDSSLVKSAELYAQIYASDEELQELTDQADADWPE